jgi:hypothetical protein
MIRDAGFVLEAADGTALTLDTLDAMIAATETELVTA